MAGNLTLALIKPHIVLERKVGKVVQCIEDTGFGIIAAKMVQLQKEGAEDFYQEHRGKDFFPNLVRVMSSGPLWALVLARPNAVEDWRLFIGDTDPAKAGKGTLREVFGNHSNMTLNAVHGSATDHDAKREIIFFFGRELKLAERLSE